MRHQFSRPFVALALVFATALTASAADIYWTNIAGGNWSLATNWNPNVIPGATDMALITASGSYTVTQDVSAVLAGLILGDGVSAPSLTNGSRTLSISGLGLVRSNALLGLGGGSLSGGGTLLIDGLGVWTGGHVANTTGLRVGANGILEITGPDLKLVYGGLTNEGRVNIAGEAALGLCAGVVENKGVFELENDQPIYQGGYCGPSLFVNTGWLRKSGGNGTNQFTGVPLANTGKLEARQGWISYNSGSIFGTGTLFNGAGTNLLDRGTVTIEGSILSTNAELAGASLLGTNIIHGVMRWTGGGIGTSARTTIAEDGELEIAGPDNKVLRGTLVNEGRVRLTGTAALGMCAGTVESSGVFDFENDQAIYQGSYCGGSLLRNTGLVRKSGGNGTNQLTSVPLVNTGTLEVKQGWIGYSSGSFFATGTQFLGSGTNLLNSGSVTFDGTIVSSNAELAGGVLYGTNLLLGQMQWTGGNIDNSARVTIGASSQLEISGAAAKYLGGTLRNEGVVRLTGAAALGMCAGTVDNAGVFELENDQPVWLGAYCGGSIFINSGVLRKSGGAATNRFASVPLANTGILKIQQGWVSYSSGSVFDTGTQFLGAGTNLLNVGSVWFNGTIVSSNAELAGANLLGTNTVHGALRWTAGNIDNSALLTIGQDGQFEISGPASKYLGGTLRNEGLVRLTSAAALGMCAGTVENLGVFELANDQPVFLGAYCGAARFLNAGLLRKIGGNATNQFAGVPLANTGTVEARSGTLAFEGGFAQATGCTRLAGGNLSSSRPIEFNGGVICGSGDIYANVNNRGELNPGQSVGLLTIHGNYSHTGALNLELGGLSPGISHDRLAITGSVVLRGTLNVCLAPGYRPQEGNAFEVMTFASRTDSIRRFGGLDLGGGKYLTPVYGPTGFTLLTTSGPTNLYQMALTPGGEGVCQLHYTCLPDKPYAIEASFYLTNDWVALCTNASPAGVIDYLDVDAPNYPRRFYRVRLAE